MRIAFTHNLQRSGAEEEAEFDTAETVRFIQRALERLGHQVDLVDVAGSAARLTARLEALRPDLVFNTAEGTHGRFREAFYPALFEQLGLPYTGSDPYVCTLTLDKELTKLVLAGHSVRAPLGKVVHTLAEVDALTFRFPVIVKPNHEGSSKGITEDSVVDDLPALRARCESAWARFDGGLLIEEFIVGRDVVVPFVEGASPETGGVLEPASYRFDEAVVGKRKHVIYDYSLKSTLSDAVHVEVPAQVDDAVRATLMETSRVVFEALKIRDAARIDFRVTDEGEVFFIEINALPSFEPGASIYLCAARVGLEDPTEVIGSVVDSAAKRFGIESKKTTATGSLKARRRGRPVRVGLTHNVKRGSDETQAEFDSPETIESIRAAIASFGHEVVLLEARADLPARIAESQIDVAFNIAEGLVGRARESQVPSLLELLGLPYTGSDPSTLSLCLDKALAKQVVEHAGVPVPLGLVWRTGKEKLPKDFPFPALAKPVAEGSSKGIGGGVCRTEAELRETVRALVDAYAQPVLVETFLPGREFTIGLLGASRPRVLPPLEILFQESADELPIYSYAHKFEGKPIQFEVPAKVDAKLGAELERVGRKAFRALGCRDVARIDVRCDGHGKVHFIECNPLPGLSPGFSDLCVIAESTGMSHQDLIGEILAPALRRGGFRISRDPA